MTLFFGGYKDGRGFKEHGEGCRICVIKNLNEKHWEKVEDL
jgi:hypothetical protein